MLFFLNPRVFPTLFSRKTNTFKIALLDDDDDDDDDGEDSNRRARRKQSGDGSNDDDDDDDAASSNGLKKSKKIRNLDDEVDLVPSLSKDENANLGDDDELSGRCEYVL